MVLLTKEKGCKIEKSKVNSLIRFESCKHQLADIYKIIRHDQEQNTDYANTLRSYLMNGWNAVRTANELHIHKSTFFYRLNKMEELFDLDITQEETMVAYEYSFILIEYLRKIKL